MKIVKLILLAALIFVKYVLLATFVFVFLAIVTLRFLLYDPSDCDKGQDDDRSSTNGSGDVVTEYFRGCSGFGTVEEYWIVLKLHNRNRTIKLVDHPYLRAGYPKFHWNNNHDLNIDFGPVHIFWPGLNRIGPINIHYSQSYLVEGDCEILLCQKAK